MKQDRARRKTDRILNNIEGAISALYLNNQDLTNAEKAYCRYMLQVDKLTKSVNEEFKNETDPAKKQKLKQNYINAVTALTTRNAEYNAIVDALCYQMALVNQQALDLINGRMEDIYIVNYNQVAEECKKVGIEVKNG